MGSRKLYRTEEGKATMCGICGVQIAANVDFKSPVPSMLDLIKHRGPDDRGDWRDERWHLGMVRLAIMDPRHGHQPMHSSDGRWVVVFNGELYNFRRLREQMLARGLRLNTQTDTEVLVELIASQGVVGTLTVIEGMFAFAALEKESGQIWLARDRFGEKPLYIDSRGSGFAFCSELSPLVVTASRSPKPSAQGILAILRHGHPWPGVTAFEGIREVMPGEWICRSATGEERNGVYWSPPDRVDEEAGSVERCGQKLLDLLEQSVRDRLVADVPLGLFLSGGLDSSTVVALASRARPDICAVTMGFDAAGYDEVPLARSTAHHLGVRLIEERAPYDSFTIAGFDCILRHYGQLFSDTSSVPTRMVSRAARRHFKVVLSGDGGDELLSGYFTHMRNALLAKWGGGSLGRRCVGPSGTFAAQHSTLGRNSSGGRVERKLFRRADPPHHGRHV